MALNGLRLTGSVPFLNPDYEEQGQVVEIPTNIRVYRTGTPARNGAVIFVPDLHGWNSGRTRAIADYIAEQLQCVVMVPALLCTPPFEDGNDGDGLRADIHISRRKEDIKQWLFNYIWEVCQAKIQCLVARCRADGIKRIGCVGSGFGAWVACHSLVAFGDVVGAILATPEIHYLEKVFSQDAKAFVGKVRQPCLLVLTADTDDKYFPGGELYQIMKGNDVVRTEAFPEMQRGFMTIGDVRDPATRRDVERFARMCVYHLRMYLYPHMPGSTPASLRLAAKQGDWQGVAKLLAEDVPAGGPDAKDDIGYAPLHYAARAGQVVVVQNLVDAGADINEVGGPRDESPLHVAASAGNANVVKELMVLRADGDVKDVSGQTPLHYAARLGSAVVLSQLCRQGVDISAVDTATQTALHLAAWNGYLDAAQALVASGADLDAEDLRSKTPQTRAEENDHMDVALFLDKERKRRIAREDAPGDDDAD